MPIIKQINKLIIFENRIERCVEVRTINGKCVEVFGFHEINKAVEFAENCKDYLTEKKVKRRKYTPISQATDLLIRKSFEDYEKRND